MMIIKENPPSLKMHAQAGAIRTKCNMRYNLLIMPFACLNSYVPRYFCC